MLTSFLKKWKSQKYLRDLENVLYILKSSHFMKKTELLVMKFDDKKITLRFEFFLLNTTLTLNWMQN